MRFTVLVVFAILVNGCTTFSKTPAQLTRVEISNGVFLDLLPANTYGENSKILQVLDFSYNQEKHSYIVQIEIDPVKDRFVLVATTRFGLKVLEVVWRQGKVEVWREKQLPNEFSPVYLLADIQLALWPLPKLQTQLRGRSVNIRSAKDERVLRVVSDIQGDIIRIQYKKNEQGLDKMILQHLTRHYEVNVDTLSYENR